MLTPSTVILTGAGISAESGLATFRDNDGLWCNHRVEDVATPEAFVRNPALVHEFYNQRRKQLQEATPNAAHVALAELAHEWQGNLLIVTQNVDDLHDRAQQAISGGDNSLLHMHGELRKGRCMATGTVHHWDEQMTIGTPCPCCKKAGFMRPHIVWFGEMPLYMERIKEALSGCDLFLSIGTSGNVYPAAGFVQMARMNGKAHTVEINMEPSQGHSLFHEKKYGRATQTVPAYVKQILNGEIF